jgi:hypothetical protein
MSQVTSLAKFIVKKALNEDQNYFKDFMKKNFLAAAKN